LASFTEGLVPGFENKQDSQDFNQALVVFASLNRIPSVQEWQGSFLRRDRNGETDCFLELEGGRDNICEFLLKLSTVSLRFTVILGGCCFFSKTNLAKLSLFPVISLWQAQASMQSQHWPV